jgi:hypothetical protein
MQLSLVGFIRYASMYYIRLIFKVSDADHIMTIRCHYNFVGIPRLTHIAHRALGLTSSRNQPLSLAGYAHVIAMNHM